MSRTPLKPSDIAELKIIARTAVRSGGERIAYEQQFADVELDKTCANLHVFDVASASSTQLTHGPHNDSQPRWSPDGRSLAFTSDRGTELLDDGTPAQNLFVVDTETLSVRQLTFFKDHVSHEPTAPLISETFTWSPDGMSICFNVKDPHSDGESPNLGLVYDKLRYKSAEAGMWDGRRKHLWTVSLASGELRRLTSGDWDAFGPTYSPDGHTIAWCSEKGYTNDVYNTLPDTNWTALRDIFTLLVDHPDKIEKVTTSPGCWLAPSFSPDGRRLAYFGFLADDSGPTPSRLFHLWSHDLATREQCDHLGGWPYIAGSQVMGDVHPVYAPPTPIWSNDCEWLYFLATVRGSANVYRVGTEAESAIPEEVTRGAHEVVFFDADPDSGTLAAIVSDAETPQRLTVGNVDGTELNTAVDPNAILLSQRVLGRCEKSVTPGADGFEFDTWVLTPPEAAARQGLPLVLAIYPSFTHGPTFNFEYQLLASNGYYVLFMNPRGATSYGPEFVEKGYWSEDYFIETEEVMAAVDRTVEAYGIDPNRVGISGEAYGGMFASWIITQTTRFRASVSRRGPTLLWLQLADRAKKVRVYTDGDREPALLAAARYTPPFYADRVETPHLMMQSVHDRRCSVVHAEEYFLALRSAGKTARLILFPTDTHFGSRLGTPRYRTEFFGHILDWFERYLK